jgi:hypothetical protein
MAVTRELIKSALNIEHGDSSWEDELTTTTTAQYTPPETESGRRFARR